jgi:hypothetical protein
MKIAFLIIGRSLTPNMTQNVSFYGPKTFSIQFLVKNWSNVQYFIEIARTGIFTLLPGLVLSIRRGRTVWNETCPNNQPYLFSSPARAGTGAVFDSGCCGSGFDKCKTGPLRLRLRLRALRRQTALIFHPLYSI